MNTIVIVDDEPKNLNALMRVFMDTEYEVVIASTGEEAMQKVEQYAPSLVVLDIMMPGMDGIEACSRIKAMNENILVLMLSARSALEDRMQGYAVQADDYMVKPYDPDELIAKVNILIRLYNAKKALDDLNRDLEETIRKRTDELVARERQAIAGRMVKGIVHNLRGPLTVALGSAQMTAIQFDKLLLTETGNDNVLNCINEIKKNNGKVLDAIGRTGDLVDSLLLQGGANPKEKPVAIDLNELIQKEYRFLRSEIILKYEVDVGLSLADDIPKITGKYSDFSQVFYNLVKNACEAMTVSIEKKLLISTEHSSTGIKLSFADTGPGIDPDKLSQIFDPFFTTKSEDRVSESGSGLGLFIASRLLAAYQAFISVQNFEAGGTVFTIMIPMSNITKGDIK